MVKAARAGALTMIPSCHISFSSEAFGSDRAACFTGNKVVHSIEDNYML